MGMDQQQRQISAANAQMAAGNAHTAAQQQALDMNYNEWARQQNYPMTQLGILQGGLNGYSSGTQQIAPGGSSNTMANVLAGGLGVGSALYNAPQLISGAKAGYDAISGLFGGGGGSSLGFYENGIFG